ncbi:MAG: anti-sigma factor family protein [Pyrinomonadaceae bacterium]
MNLPNATTEKKCSREKIAAYLDGELAPREEIILEKHIAECKDCLAELNLQKRMFSVLETAFDEKAKIELPENFARIVATRAETNVKGLRSKDERFRALFFCSFLFLIIAAGLGAETSTVFDSFGRFGEQLLAVLNFTGHLIYDLIVGMTVILRAFGSQPIFNTAIILALLFGAITFLVIWISRHIYESKRS